MKIHRHRALPLVFLGLWVVAAPGSRAQDSAALSQSFAAALQHIVQLFNPETGQTFHTRVKLLEGERLPKPMIGKEVGVAFQAPDRLRVQAEYDGAPLHLGRDGQTLWVRVPAKRFGVLGLPNLPRFSGVPDSIDPSPLAPIKLPLAVEQTILLPLLVNLQSLPDASVAGVACRALEVRPKPEALAVFKIDDFKLHLWVRAADHFPMRATYYDERNRPLTVELVEPKFSPSWPADRWQLAAEPGDQIERVARAHLDRFFATAGEMLGDRIPALGPATGERRLVAREGQGRLEKIDGTRVLFLKGSPEEMGRQHGVLLQSRVRDLVDRILYGVGVGSSFEKGRWFFGEIESAQQRLMPFMDPRYLREMDALALAAGLPRQEVHLANFFPELFHCSGFALFGRATEDGQMYHGRVLDYLRGMGLEQNAVVIVCQPDQGNAWVNVSYAGFIGSVTAMNEKHLAIGEMGGRGEGNWDGKPMAQLVREVMERASTLEQAVEIMRRGPRTCEYYYVISDGKTGQAVGIAATPGTFETIRPGEHHPRLPHAIEDAVLMSANERYEALAQRVREGYGTFNSQRARDVMKRPVCMNSNIHSVLFAPGTLDFWVANADSEQPAAHVRYTHYNLAALLKSLPPP